MNADSRDTCRAGGISLRENCCFWSCEGLKVQVNTRPLDFTGVAAALLPSMATGASLARREELPSVLGLLKDQTDAPSEPSLSPTCGY